MIKPFTDLRFDAWLRRMISIKSETLWVFVDQTGNALGIFLGMKVLTQFLNPAEFGRLSIANTIVLLVSVGLFGPLGNGFLRFWSISHDGNQVRDFVSISDQYAFWLLSGVTVISLFFFIFCSLTGLLSGQALLLALALGVGASRGYSGLRVSVLLGARKRKVVALLNAGAAIAKPLAATGLIFLFVSNADIAMWGYLIATIAFLLLAENCYRTLTKEDLTHFSHTGRSRNSSRQMGKEILRYSWPFCAWGVFVWIYQSCDRWSLAAYHSDAVVGAFSVVALLSAYPLMFSSNFLLNLCMPVAYEHAGDLSSNRAVKSASKFLLVMMGLYLIGCVVLIGVFFLFHRGIILLMSSPEYVGFSFLLPTLTISWALFYSGETLAAFGYMVKRPQIYVLPKLTCSIMAAVSSFYFSAKFGPTGVVWALMISSACYACWCAIIGFVLFKGLGKK